MCTEQPVYLATLAKDRFTCFSISSLPSAADSTESKLHIIISFKRTSNHNRICSVLICCTLIKKLTNLTPKCLLRTKKRGSEAVRVHHGPFASAVQNNE